MYKQALEFIARKHSGQTRRNGNPYIIHPIRVSLEMKHDEEKIAALLHDVVEDTDATVQEICDLFGFQIANAVEHLTKRKGEHYMEYIHRVKMNDIATAVKIADIADNLSDSPSNSAVEKSARALEILIN